MRGDVKGKGKPTLDRAADPRGRAPAATPIDDVMLREYLAETLAPEESARVEKALRDSAELRARLEDVRQNRADGQLHTLGAIWLRSRLTCPSRQQLGSLLLDALDPDLASYVTFHLEVVECPYCRANLNDLQAQSQTASAAHAAKSRQHRILQSIQNLLGEDKRG
jgi:uncharacterized protein YbaR (Trm112 family)